jgi:hypothetical protein
VGWRGKDQLKCGDGRKLLVAVGCPSFKRARPFQEGRAPFKKGMPLSERARPYCLLDRQGAQAPIDYLIGRGLKHLLIT